MQSEKIDILLVDDSTDDAFLVTWQLKKYQQSLSIHHAKDGEEALNFFFDTPQGNSSTQSKPTLILLDLKMPKVDGLEVLTRLKKDENTKDIPVVVLTSSAHYSDISKAYKLGANSYLVKPVNYDEFQTTVADLSKYWLSLNKYFDTPQSL